MTNPWCIGPTPLGAQGQIPCHGQTRACCFARCTQLYAPPATVYGVWKQPHCTLASPLHARESAVYLRTADDVVVGSHSGNPKPSPIMTTISKAKQSKARQLTAMQGKAGQGGARQGKARQGEARRGEARQGEARQQGIRDTIHNNAPLPHPVA